jgi:hypothetical protein
VAEEKIFLEEKKFGLLVGGVLIALGTALELLKHRRAAFLLLAGIGALLVFLSFAAPGALVVPNRYWMKFAHLLGRVNTAVFLFVVFFFVLTPLGFVMRLFGRDELRRRRAPADSMWVPYPERNRDLTHFEKLF